MEEKYLPVGSVCMLKGGQKAVMVVGYGIQPKENPNVVYDYLGALYPEGIVTMDQNMVFNHENIDRVLFKGYETEEQKSFNKQIVQIIGQMKNGSVANSNIINEYFVEFTTSSSGTTISLPSTIKWANGETPTFEANTTYQISIVNNLGVVITFK